MGKRAPSKSNLRLGLLGHNIGHSLSPMLHTGFAKALGLSCSYDVIDTPPATDLEALLAELHSREQYDGLNVTVPYKQRVFDVLRANRANLAQDTGLSTLAQQLGAVNTLVRTKTGWRGENTDRGGFAAALAWCAPDRVVAQRWPQLGSERTGGGVGVEGRDPRAALRTCNGYEERRASPELPQHADQRAAPHRLSWRPPALADAGIAMAKYHVLLLGAGGAAVAVAHALIASGASNIVVCARRCAQTEDLIRAMQKIPAENPCMTCRSWPWVDRAEAAEQAHMIVNATPLGSVASTLDKDTSPLPASTSLAGKVVIDLIYAPALTPLLAHAQAHGAQILGGWPMLVEQGLLSLELWLGRRLTATEQAMAHAAVKRPGD